MSVFHHHVPAMQHVATLMDPFNVHVTMDFQEMEQLAQVYRYCKHVKLINYMYHNVIFSWIISNKKLVI